MVKGSLKSVSRKFREYFKEFLGKCQGGSKRVLRGFQVSNFKGVQGYLKEDSMEFQGSFKEVSRVFSACLKGF